MAVDPSYGPYYDYDLFYAINEIATRYGHICRIDQDFKRLSKFGGNENVDNLGLDQTLQQFEGTERQEVFQTDNTIDSMSCSDNSFTENVQVEGFTIDGNGDFTRVTQTLTATGQTPVTLTTPLARIRRAFNAGATDMPASSTLYFYRSVDTTVTNGVPNTDSAINMLVTAANQQSLKASDTIAKDEYLIATKLYAGIASKSTAGAAITLKVREKGGVFRTTFKIGVNSRGPNLDFNFAPYGIVQPNSDLLLTADADTNNTSVSGGFMGYLFKFST